MNISKKPKDKSLRSKLLLAKHLEDLEINHQFNSQPDINIKINRDNDILNLDLIIKNYKKEDIKKLINSTKSRDFPRKLINKKGILSRLSRTIIEEINYIFDKNEEFYFKEENPYNKSTKKYNMKIRVNK